MSSIRKFNDGEWKKFAQTNADAKNLMTTVDGKTTTIEQAIQSNADDIAKLQRNVSWLALHGGGGGGGGGSSSVVTAKAKITINGNQSNSTFAIVNGTSIDIVIDFTPKKTTNNWRVTVTIGSYNRQFSLSPASPTKSIKYEDFSSQLKTDSTTGITVTAYYPGDENVSEGSSTWSGYIYLADITIRALYDNTIPLAKILDGSTEHPTMKITAETPLKSELSCTTTLYDAGSSYTLDCGRPETGNIWVIKIADMFGDVSTGKGITKAAGVFAFDIAVSALDGDRIIQKINSFQLKITAEGVISLAVSGISKILSQPTLIPETKMGASLAIEAYLVNATGYTVEAYVSGKTDPIWRGGPYQYSGTSKNVFYPYITFERNLFPSYDTTYQITFIARDSADTRITGESKHYLQIEKSKNSYLQYGEETVNKQIVGIYSGSGRGIVGTTLEQFNNIQSHMELSSSLPSVKDKKLKIDFQWLNDSTKVDLDDSFLNSLRVSNGSFFTVRPEVGSMTFYASPKWTVGLTIRSDEYVEDDVILALYGYYDEKTDTIDGIVIKPHGIYSRKGESNTESLLVNLVDSTPNIIHIVYSNGWDSEHPINTWYKGNKDSFFKIYLNGVMSYIGSDCPFMTTTSSGLTTITNFYQHKLYVGGVGRLNKYHGNINVYSIEMFTEKLNEIGIVVSETNSKVMTHSKYDGEYVDVDFTYQTKELSANFCSLIEDSNCISSLIYNESAKTFTFDKLYIHPADEQKEKYAPPTEDTKDQYQYSNEIQSMPFPIVYIDVSKNDEWTIENFLKAVNNEKDHPLYDKIANSILWYWDPSVRSYSDKINDVKINIQGTSTLQDHIKNLDVTLPYSSSEETMLFVNDKWIPEHTYTLKADVVDSSHSNNAALGSFINETCGVNDDSSSKGFDFEIATEAINNVLQSKTTLANIITDSLGEPLLKNISVKHTVEGFPVLLMIRFYNSDITKGKTFTPLGIYSFNLGRSAFRNIGFKSITSIEETKALSFKGIPSVGIYKVNESSTVSSFWIERSLNGSISLSALEDDTTTIISSINTGAGSFWNTDDKLLDAVFNTRYSTEIDEEKNKFKPPSFYKTFTDYADTIQKLPLEGTIHFGANGIEQKDITGSYQKYKYDGINIVPDGNEQHKMTNVDVTTAYKVNSKHQCKYNVIALLFGLRDSFDKNISYRSWGTTEKQIVYTDFYDLDTSLGLANQGSETQSVIMLFKYIMNQIGSDGLPICRESYNGSNQDPILKDMTILPESTGNKLIFSVDSSGLRDDVSEMTVQWFRMRDTFDKLAVEAGYSGGVVDWFMEEFFEKQTAACGSMFFNYDYNSKYLNTFDSDTVENIEPQTSRKCHGRRYEFVKKWLTEHIIFLDAYFFWRGNMSYGPKGTSTANLISYLNRYVSITHSNTASDSNYVNVLARHHIIPFTTGDSKQLAPALVIRGKPTHMRIPTNGADDGSTAAISFMNSFLSVDWNTFRINAIVKGTNLTSVYNLIDFTVNRKVKDILNQKDFYDSYHVSQLRSLNYNNLTSLESIYLDISPRPLSSGSLIKRNVFKSLNQIDISQSKGIEALNLSDTPLKSLNVLSSNITSLKINNNQPYIPLPDITGCKQLTEVYLNGFVSTVDVKKTNYKLHSFDNLTSFIIQKCNSLQSLEISACNSLQTIDISECSGLTSISILSCENLQSDNLRIIKNPDLNTIKINYCHNLSSFTYQVDKPQNVKQLDFSWSKIAQINRVSYNDKGEIIYTKMDDSGNKRLSADSLPVLDLRDFSNLRFYGDDTPSSIRANTGVQALRLPNILSKPIPLHEMGSWGRGDECTNLQRIYGNTVIVGSAFSEISATLFNGEDSNKIKSITFSDTRKTIWEALGVQDNDLADIFEDSSTTQYLSSAYEGKILKFPVKIHGKDFNDFDSSEWGRNFSITAVNASTFRDTDISYTEINYILFKIAMYNYFNSSKITNIDQLFRSCKIPRLTDYSFKGLKDINCTLDLTFAGTYEGQHLTRKMLSCIPNITGYARCFNTGGSRISVDYDAFWNNTKITTFGSDAYTNAFQSMKIVLTKDAVGDKVKISSFFKNKPLLTSITHFDILSCDYGMLNIPASVTNIYASFNNNDVQSIIDFPEIFQDNSRLRYIDYTFNGDNLSIIYRPSSLSGLRQLTAIGSYNAAGVASGVFGRGISPKSKLLIVKDSYEKNGITYPFTRENAFDYASQYVDFLSSDMINFQQSFLSNQTQLKIFVYMFENADLTSFHRGQIVSAFTFPGKLFEKTTSIEDLPYCMQNFDYPIELTQCGFKNCHNLKSLRYLFYQSYDSQYNTSDYSANIVKYNKGVVSEIPYRFFYHGSQISSVSISGIEDSKSPQIPPTDKQYREAIEIATQTKKFSYYKENIISTMLNVQNIFNQISSAPYSTTITSWFDFPNKLDTLSNSFEPLIDDDGKVNSKEPFRTMYYNLSSISSNFSTKENIYNNLYKNVLQLSTTGKLNVEVFNTNLRDVMWAFHGNGNIKTYTGKISTEINSDYMPFRFKWDGENWTDVSSKIDRFLYDDSWSQNGEVWTLNERGEKILAYNPKHKNTVDSTMSSLLITKGEQYKIRSRAQSGSANVAAFYYNYDGYASEMKYICAPDLFRYMKNDSSTWISRAFESTSNEYYTINVNDTSTESVDKKQTVYCGLKGRIPPNLFKTVTKIVNLNGMFGSCKYITGYRTIKDGRPVIKYIPDQLFSYFEPSLTSMTFMFYNNIMPFSIYEDTDLDLETPFKNMKTNNSYYKDISGIFSKCVWLNKNNLSHIFNNLFIAGCHGAFTYEIIKGSYDGFGRFIPNKTYYDSSTLKPDDYGEKESFWPATSQDEITNVSGKKVSVNIRAKIGESVFDKEIKILNKQKQYAVYAYQTNNGCNDFTDTFSYPFGWSTT